MEDLHELLEPLGPEGDAPLAQSTWPAELPVITRPDKGRARVGGKMIEVEFAQDLVFVAGEHVGYVGHQAGAPVCLIGQPSLRALAAIQKAYPGRRIAIPAEAPAGWEHGGIELEDESDQ